MKNLILLFALLVFSGCTSGNKDNVHNKKIPTNDNLALFRSEWALDGYLDTLVFSNISNAYEKTYKTDGSKAAVFFNYVFDEPVLKLYNDDNKKLLYSGILKGDTLELYIGEFYYKEAGRFYGKFSRVPKITYQPKLEN